MSFYPDLGEQSTEKLEVAFRGKPPEGDDDAFLYYPAVAVHLAESGSAGLSFLETALADSDPFRVFAAIIGLGCSPDVTRYEPQIVALLNDARPLVVSGAIDYLTGHKLKEYLDTVAALAEHPDVAVITAALQYLAIVHPERAPEWLSPALRHPDPRVRWRACDGFEEVGRPADAELLRPLLRDPDKDVREKAKQAIHLLHTGELPYPMDR